MPTQGKARIVENPALLCHPEDSGGTTGVHSAAFWWGSRLILLQVKSNKGQRYIYYMWRYYY